MLPSLLQGTKRIAGANQEFSNLADSYDQLGLNTMINSLGPVQAHARRQPAFRTQDLILGLLPALLGGGQQYVADYLKGKFGAADQLTQEDQAKAQEEQKRKMMMGQLQGNFYIDKAKRMREGQDIAMKRGWQLQDQASRVAQDKLNQTQAMELEGLKASNRLAEEKGRAKDRYLSQVFGTGKVRPPREAVEGMYEVQGWNLDDRERGLLDALYAADDAASRKLLREKRIGELDKIKDYSKVNYAPDFESMAKQLSEYKDDPLMQYEAERFRQKAKDAGMAYKQAQAYSIERLNNEKLKGKLTQTQIAKTQEFINQMPEKLRLYAASLVKTPKSSDERAVMKDIGSAAKSLAIRYEKQIESIKKSAGKYSTEEDWLKIPAYVKAKEAYEKNLEIAVRALDNLGAGGLDVPAQADDGAKERAYANARKAIAAGADKAAVNARLKKSGYAPLP